MSRLYHFTKYTSLLQILENNRLRYGDVAHTNDPKEYFEPRLSVEYYFPVTTPRDVSDINQMLHAELQKYRILCFSMEGTVKGYMRPRMWAQYSQMHEGCCMVFDQQILEKQIDLTTDAFKCNGEVAYTAENGVKLSFKCKPNDIIENEIERFVVENIQYFFFTKSQDWKSEDELRYLIRPKDSDDQFVDIATSGVAPISWTCPNWRRRRTCHDQNPPIRWSCVKRF